MPPLVVRPMPVSRLKSARYNPRKPLRPGSRAYQKLRASIERFGLVEPLVWNARSGRLVGGHARLSILKDLGVTEVPVAIVRLDPTEEKALNVVLNNPEAQGRYDPRKLHAVLQKLKDLDALEASGFSESALRAFRFEPAIQAETDGDVDRVEVTLIIPALVYSSVEPKLDTLVRKFDLESHVAMRAEKKQPPSSHKERRER